MDETLKKVLDFFALTDENGLSNLDKVHKYQKVLRRVETTAKDRSVEAAEGQCGADGLPCGVVMENGKLIGLGIHIFNADIYPLKSFEISLRSCDLHGRLDISGGRDMLFLDLYHNRITAIETRDLPAMRIFGVQDNLLSALDVSQMPACQGIDVGRNRLTKLDVRYNPQLVELYVNDNALTDIDLSRNPLLKYFYCHNNRLTRLDTRANPLLRHLNATGNPLRQILSWAPQSSPARPLELYAEGGGCVGLRFNPVYDAQWQETGVWQQSYYALPAERHRFCGWFDEQGDRVSDEAEWVDDYGASRILTARFAAE